MERTIVLGALSSFQIFHQCLTNNLWLNHYFKGRHLTLLAVSFPAGKVLGTLIVPFINARNGLKATLFFDAILLVAGSIVSLFPRYDYIWFKFLWSNAIYDRILSPFHLSPSFLKKFAVIATKLRSDWKFCFKKNTPQRIVGL